MVTARAPGRHLRVNHAYRTTHLRSDRRTPQRLPRSCSRHRQAPSPAALAQQRWQDLGRDRPRRDQAQAPARAVTARSPVGHRRGRLTQGTHRNPRSRARRRTTALGWSPGGLRARARARRPTGHHPRPQVRRVGAPPPPPSPARQAAPPVTSRIPDMSRADPLAQSMRSLLEAAQQAARPVTPRTWREMTWSERWRWLRLRTTGSERLTDRDLKAADELKAVLERMKEEAGFGKPTAPTARPGDGAESRIIRWGSGGGCPEWAGA